MQDTSSVCGPPKRNFDSRGCSPFTSLWGSRIFHFPWWWVENTFGQTDPPYYILYKQKSNI